MLYTDIVFSFNLTISERAGDVSRQKQVQNKRKKTIQISIFFFPNPYPLELEVTKSPAVLHSYPHSTVTEGKIGQLIRK